MLFPRGSGTRHDLTALNCGDGLILIFEKLYHEVLSVQLNMTIIKKSD
jgi:hypothetical protein